MPSRELGPRERMIRSTSRLIRERGARATSIDAVLGDSGAPRGSVYHHFPGGREQLLREATESAGEFVARRIERLGAAGPIGAIEALFDDYGASLVATDFRAGCPIVAVAVETPADGPDLRDVARSAFDRWRGALTGALQAAGVGATEAGELSLYVLSAFEGAVVLSKTYRNLEPLETARRELRARLETALS